MYDVRDMQLLQETLNRYNCLINAPSLYELSDLSTVSNDKCTASIQLLHVTKLPDSSLATTFSYILNALAALDPVIGYIICVTPQDTSIYMGLKGDVTTAFSLLQAGLIHSFPNIVFEVVNNPASFLTGLFTSYNYTQLASTTVIPNPTNTTTSLLTQFTNLMGTSTSYVAFFLAQPISRCVLLKYQSELFEIYNILSLFTQSTHNSSHGLAKNSSTTIIRCETCTEGNSHTKTVGNNIGHTKSGYNNVSISGGTTCPFLQNQNLNTTLLSNSAISRNDTNSCSHADGNTRSNSDSHTKSRLSAENLTDNYGMTYTMQDKRVQDALTTLSTFLNRIQLLLQTNAFKYGAYFFSPEMETSIRAAYSFLGLAQDTSVALGPGVVNLWPSNNPYFASLFESLVTFDIPQFCTCKSDKVITSATLVQSTELLNTMYLPID